MRAKRSAAAPEASASPAAARAAASSGCRPPSRSSVAAQRERDLDQARLGGARVREHAERLAHLDRVARRAAEHLVHVGEQRLAGEPVAARDGDDRARQLGALLAARA